MLLCFSSEICYNAKLLSGFGEKWECAGVIGHNFRVGLVRLFFTRKALHIQSRRLKSARA
jgi:hypothetical protein